MDREEARRIVREVLREDPSIIIDALLESQELLRKIIPPDVATKDDIRMLHEEIKLLIEMVNKRFEDMQRYMDKRFEDMNRRFEDMQRYMNKRFEDMQRYMDKRFEDMQRYMDKRFEDMNRRLIFIERLIIAFNAAILAAILSLVVKLWAG